MATGNRKLITSTDNPKLKLARGLLRERRVREREGLFASEGEDLLEVGLAAGREPELVLAVPDATLPSGLERVEVEPGLLGSASVLGSGSRVIALWREAWARPAGPVCVYLHGVGDPGNVGAVIRSAHALTEGSVALGPGCADPHSPRAVRASMGSVLAIALARCSAAETPPPRVALVAHGGTAPVGAPGATLTLCVGAERDGLPEEVVEICDTSWTIPLRPGGAESLNVAAATAIALQRISSAVAEPGAQS